MLSRRVLARVLGVDAKAVRLESVEVLDDGIEVRVRPRVKARWCCPHCGVRRPGYDPGRERRWRTLDLGRTKTFVVAAVPRVSCPEHGVVVAGVPWARHGARHTWAFEQVAAWCAVEMSATAAATLLRCSWRTIGAIITRVVAELDGDEPFEALTRIGIDEISYRKHHRYLLVVVDHDRRRLVHAAAGANTTTLGRFFDLLGEPRLRPDHSCQRGRGAVDHPDRHRTRPTRGAVRGHVPCRRVGHRRPRPGATRHLERVRVRRRGGRHASGPGKTLKDARWALWKNPEHHNAADRARLDYIAATHPRLHRAWALKEGLRVAVTSRGPGAITALDRWITWAQRSRIPTFVELARRIRRHRTAIVATIEHGLTNALVESTNTKIRLICRRAYGFRNVDALIALARLTLSGQRPELPT